MSTDAKLIQVSLDDVTYNTLPGSSGEISVETSDNDNTIYGGVFASSLPGVADFTLSGNAWLRQTPGFQATVKRAGTGTTFTGEAMEQEDGQTYIITDKTKDLWDYNVGVTVFDDASEVSAANIESIDYLFGRVTFVAGYSVVGAITVDGSYFPVATFGCANSISLTQNAEAILASCFDTTQTENGYNTYDSGLKTVSAELSGFYRTANDFFTILSDRDTIILEVDWEGDGQTKCRGVFNVQSYSQSGDVGQQEESSVTFNLFVPEDILPFSWYFGATSKMSPGMKDIINAWITRQNLYFKYFPTGTLAKSYAGQVVVTDASISTSVDAIGELSLSSQGDGELIEVAAP